MNETAILIFDSSFYYGLFFSQRFLSHKPPVNTCMLLLMFQYMYRQIPVHARVHTVWRVFKWEITFEIGERTFVERLNAHTTVLQWRIINDCIMFGGIVRKKRKTASCKKMITNFCWIRAINMLLTAVGSNVYASIHIENLWKIQIQKLMNLWHNRF